MITIGPNYLKLKTSLQLACHRLKLLQIKKSELSEKLKREVAEYIKNGKCVIARIKAHQILKYVATVEAMEIVEMHCEELSDRFELFQKMKRPDISLVVAVSSLIWVSPYFETHIAELKVISKQLAVKYGNLFYRHASSNDNGKVNQDLIDRVALTTPLSDDKINSCLLKICIKYGLPYYEYLDKLPKLFKTEEGQSENRSSCVSADHVEELEEENSRTECRNSRTPEIDETATNKKTCNKSSESISDQKQAGEREESNSNTVPDSSTLSVMNDLSLDYTDKLEGNDTDKLKGNGTDKLEGNDNQLIDLSVPEDNLNILSTRHFQYVSVIEKHECQYFNIEKDYQNDNNFDQDSTSSQLQKFNGRDVIYPKPPPSKSPSETSPYTSPPPSYASLYKENDRTKEYEQLQRSQSELQLPTCPSETPDSE